MKNIYFDKLYKHLQSYVEDFNRLRTATLTQLQLDMDTLKNPRPSMERTFRQAIECAYSLKEQMLSKGKQILDYEKDKLSTTTETTILEELKKLNNFHDFQTRLTYMPINELRQFGNEENLSEMEVHQIKAELAHRKANLNSKEETAEIDAIIQSIRFISPIERLKEATNALEQLRTDKNVYPFLSAHLAMDNNIPRLLGSDMLSELDGHPFFGEGM